MDERPSCVVPFPQAEVVDPSQSIFYDESREWNAEPSLETPSDIIMCDLGKDFLCRGRAFEAKERIAERARAARIKGREVVVPDLRLCRSGRTSELRLAGC